MIPKFPSFEEWQAKTPIRDELFAKGAALYWPERLRAAFIVSGESHWQSVGIAGHLVSKSTPVPIPAYRRVLSHDWEDTEAPQMIAAFPMNFHDIGVVLWSNLPFIERTPINGWAWDEPIDVPVRAQDPNDYMMEGASIILQTDPWATAPRANKRVYYAKRVARLPEVIEALENTLIHLRRAAEKT